VADDDFQLASYDFTLPPERVAQQPLPERDASRLMLVDRAHGSRAHQVFRDLPDLLRPGDLLVLNRTRVFPARLLGRRAGGGAAVVLLLRAGPDGSWDALLRPGRRLRRAARIDVAPGVALSVEDDPAQATPTRRVRFLLDDGDTVEAALARHGHVPLPPYIRRPDTAPDRDRYQTVFAREPGSVAAPTAGLHFTPALLERLAERGIETASLVLHVGAGTFRPVEVDDVRQHRVDPERFTLPAETAAAVDRAKAERRRVVAVGTTVTRALESACDASGCLRAGDGETALVILPGHPFRVVDALVTNFHLPCSSLLLLVSAFAGRSNVLAAYAEAVASGYRFYSYGDAMLVV
jgi:S-adenosylmethionine:tRNA ribosyltransferase-isomerase